MIGVLGGTFDPIHYGHLYPAREVLCQLGFERLHLIPSATPPHRPNPVAAAAERYEMTKLAAAEFPGFIADDREVRRGGLSYTVDTLREMRRMVGERPLCFLLGADAFAGLTAWQRWEELFALAHLVVVRRPGADPAVPAWAEPRICNASDIAHDAAGGIVLVAVTPRDISATALRAAIARGEKPPADTLPPAVWDYIHRHNIYRSMST